MLDYDIRQMYEDMEIRLIQSMKRNLQLHLDEEDETGFKYPQWQAMKLKELKKYQRQNKDIVGHDTKGFSTSISKYLKRELREGSYNAIKQSREAMGDKYKANKRLSNSFFKINDKKVNTLINSVNNDLKTANRAVLRMTNDQYRKVIFQSQLYVANGVMTPAQAIDAANKDFLRRGLNVIEYKDGKRVNIASYSQMAIRTAGQRATLIGEGAARKKLKQHLIQISAHGTSCELCIPWQGKVLIDDVYSGGSSKDGKYTLLSEAMDQGLFHPNCRHGISTYFGGKDDISDINASFANGKDGHESDAAYQDDMNYINRKIREYQRLEVGSLDETNVKTYRKKRKQWEKKKVELEQPKDNKKVNIKFNLPDDNSKFTNTIKENIEILANEYKTPLKEVSYTSAKKTLRTGEAGSVDSITGTKLIIGQATKENIYHEFAHTLASEHRYKLLNENTEFWEELIKIRKDYYKEVRNIDKKSLGGTGFNRLEALNKIAITTDNKYFDTSIDEFLAEGFTYAKLGKTNSPYAKRILELVDKYFKKK